MKNYKHLLAALALMLPAPALAQYTIYPVPQEQVAGTGTLSMTKEVCIVCEPGIDYATQLRAREVLEARADQMHTMASVLLDRETVEGDAVNALLDNQWDAYLAAHPEEDKTNAADAEAPTQSEES